MPLDENDLKLIEGLIDKIILAKIPVKKVRKKRVVKKSPSKVKPKKISKSAQGTQQPSNIISLVNTSRQSTSSGKLDSVLSSKGRQCRSEPFVPLADRPNNFLNSKDAQLHKKDTKIDKLLSKGIQPTLRRDPTVLYEVQCKQCGSIHIVSGNMILKDQDTQEVSYICDNCIRR
jgi:hypothetical protein